MESSRVFNTTASDADSAEMSAEYRRRARRLRHEHRQNPARMMRSLQALSAKVDREYRRTDYAPGSEAELGKSFALEVAEQMHGGVLRYSSRMALLKRAETMGIGRFEANLLIAMVVHAAKGTDSAEPKSRRRWVGPLLVVAIVEGLVGLGVWWLLR